MNKSCSKCGEEKHVDEFNVNRAKADGLQSFCRECGKKGSKVYYLNNSPRMRRQIGEANQRRIQKAQEFVVSFLLSHPCIDCGEDDVIVLEFDHVRGEKSNNVSQMVCEGYGVDSIAEEIAKCDVRCANCHRRRTAQAHHRLLAALENVRRKTRA